MLLKILKILTPISFLAITIKGDIVGGPYGAFLLLSFVGGILPAISGIVISAILLVFLSNAIMPTKHSDLVIFIVGGAVLFIPILAHVLFATQGWLFFGTLLPFVVIYSLTLFMLIRQKRNSVA